MYLSEAEIAKEVIGPNRLTEWKALAIILERKGFPKIDPMFGGRYMPAVRKWLDEYNHIESIQRPRRGREQWPQKSKRQGCNGETETEANVYPFGSPDKN